MTIDMWQYDLVLQALRGGGLDRYTDAELDGVDQGACRMIVSLPGRELIGAELTLARQLTGLRLIVAGVLAQRCQIARQCSSNGPATGQTPGGTPAKLQAPVIKPVNPGGEALTLPRPATMVATF